MSRPRFTARGGPFTLVPLPDRDGLPCSAVVWMERGPEIARLAALPRARVRGGDEPAFLPDPGPADARLSALTIWPIISQIADRMSGERTALMAEAAHVMPPIGAQGLNMSLADLTALLRSGAGQPDRIWGQRQCWKPITNAATWMCKARVAGIDALNRASMMGSAELARSARRGAERALFRGARAQNADAGGHRRAQTAASANLRRGLKHPVHHRAQAGPACPSHHTACPARTGPIRKVLNSAPSPTCNGTPAAICMPSAANFLPFWMSGIIGID